jgi:hypothetical protein
MPADPRSRHTRTPLRSLAQELERAGLFGLKVLAVPIGLAGAILLAWGLVGAFQRLSFNSRSVQIWMAMAGGLLVADALLALWDHLSAHDQAKALKRWQGLTNRVLRSRAFGLWPVLLVLLTSLVGLTDWFPASGPDRLMMLGSIAAVAIYGYFREKAEKRRDLLAFADEARDRFAEAAKQIHAERDREIEEREREIEERERGIQIDRLADDLEDRFSELKEDAKTLGVPFRNLVDTTELKDQLNAAAGFSLTDLEFQLILTRLGLEP